MRVLVCGGRNYRNPNRVREVLGTLRRHRRMELLIHGDAWGADSWASAWAENAGVDQVKFPANWSGRGRGAGPFRNQLMIDLLRPDLVVAFPGGSGTADMVCRAEAAGIEVLEVKESIAK